MMFFPSVSGFVPRDDGEKWNEVPQVPVSVGMQSAEPPEPVDMETADNQLPSGPQEDTNIKGTVVKQSLNSRFQWYCVHSIYVTRIFFVWVGSDGSDSSRQLEDLREQLKATLEFCLSR